jgi:hypothetical protein
MLKVPLQSVQTVTLSVRVQNKTLKKISFSFQSAIEEVGRTMKIFTFLFFLSAVSSASITIDLLNPFNILEFNYRFYYDG